MARSDRVVGLGAMRLSTDEDRDDARGQEVLDAAIEAGVTLIDTAPTYGLGQGDEHHNERLVAASVARSGRGTSITIVTKCGMIREGRTWVPDGRAKAIARHAEASLLALGGGTLDALVLHAPDPKTPIAASMRALDELRRAGVARSIGVSNVSRAQLEATRAVAHVDYVEVEGGAFEDGAFRSGVVLAALEAGATVLLHSPLGGTKRAPKLARDAALAVIADRHGVSPAVIVLAYLYAQAERIVPLPGARRALTARSCAAAASVRLDAEDLACLCARFSGIARGMGRVPRSPRATTDREVVLIMGIQGAGKSRAVYELAERGYTRLNRDERGGTLRALAAELDAGLEAGGDRFVLDNTYGKRADRSVVIEVAEKHGARVRCVHLDTPLEIAHGNAVRRLLDRYGAVPSAEELKKLQKGDPHAFLPTVQLRYARELEAPTEDEGFFEISRVPYSRAPSERERFPGRIVALDALAARAPGSTSDVATLVFAWQGARDLAELERIVAVAKAACELPSEAELAVCPHPGGPPTCWCRPPLPGLVIPWMVRRGIDPAQTVLIGTSALHASLARGLEVGFELAGGTGQRP